VVERYLKLLEQAYIIKRVRSYAKNGRNELKKSFKVYFIDLGIRNAVLGKTQEELEKREDRGLLFENLLFLELLKKGAGRVFPKEIYFWRTRDQKEIDFLWVEGDKIQAIECKWNEKETQKFTTFKKLYPTASTQVVYPKDLLDERFLEQK
jgi:predicted AAA+ superfamily ATPase